MKKGHWILIFLLFSVFFSLFPYWKTYQNLSPNEVLSPIGNFRVSGEMADFHQHFSQTREVKDGNFLSGDPMTWEGKESFNFQYLTYLSSTFFGSIPWLFTDDARVAYLGTKILSYFSFSFLLFLVFGLGGIPPVFSAIASIVLSYFSYGFNAVSNLFVFIPSFIDPRELLQWSWTRIHVGPYGFENQLSRFLNPSLSAPIGLLGLYAAFRFLKERTSAAFFLLLFSSILVQFSYLPIAALFNFFLMVLTLSLFFQKDRERLKDLKKIGFCLLGTLALLVIGYLATAGGQISPGTQHDFGNYFYPRNFSSDLSRFFKAFLSYSPWMIVSFFLYRRHQSPLNCFLFSLSIGFCASLSAYLILGEHVGNRFNERASAVFLPMVLVLLFGIFFRATRKKIDNLSFFQRRRKAFHFLVISLAVTYSIIFIYRSGKLIASRPNRALEKKFYVLEKSKMELFRWIDQKTPKESVFAAFDSDLISLIPVFTHGNLFIPSQGTSLSTKEVRSETHSLLKTLGFKRKNFLELLQAFSAHDSLKSWLHHPQSGIEKISFVYWWFSLYGRHARVIRESRHTKQFDSKLLSEFELAPHKPTHRLDYLILSSKEKEALVPAGELLFSAEDLEVFSFSSQKKQ